MKSLETIIDESFDAVPKLMDYPIHRDLLSYPIDLTGHFCEMDCALTNRRLAVQAAARTKPDCVREFTERLELAIDEKLTDNYQKVVLSYRQADISEFLVEAEAAHGDTSRLQQEVAYVKAALKADPVMLSMDAALTAAEYACGLRKDPAQIPKHVLDVCEQELHVPFDWEAFKPARTEPAKASDTLEIHMDDTSWYPKFMAVSDLKLYTPQTHPTFTPPSAKDYDVFLEQFSVNTYRRELVMYEALEQEELRPVIDGQQRTDPITKEDLIFIDGVSLKEWTDYSMAMHPTPASREAVSASLLSQALSNSDHYVECYLPDDKNRSIQTEPVRLTQDGVKPAEMEKPAMNAWQRFWSKHGHYQELAAQVRHYETVSEFRKQAAESIQSLSGPLSSAWEEKVYTRSVQACEAGSKKVREGATALGAQLFGEAYATNRGSVENTTWYRFQRSGINLGICMLVREGMSLEDILDPEKEPEKKAEVSEKLRAMALRDDPKEFLEAMVPAMEQIMALPNIDMDYMDFTQAAPHAAEIRARACLYDMFQETERCGSHLTEMLGKKEADAFLDRANRYGTFYERLSQCIDLGAMDEESSYADMITNISYFGQYQAIVNDYGPRMNGGMTPDCIHNDYNEAQGIIMFECAEKASGNEEFLKKIYSQGLSGRQIFDCTFADNHVSVTGVRITVPEAAGPKEAALPVDGPQKAAPAPQARRR